MAIELNIWEKDNLFSVLTFLKDQLPRSLLLWQLLTYIQSKIVSEEDISPQIFVDHLTEMKCVIILYAEPGSVIEQNSFRNVGIVCDKESSKDILLSMFIKCIPWNQKLMFSALEQRSITPIIEQIIREKQFGNSQVFSYIQYELDRQVFIEKLNVLPRVVPPGIDIRPLKLEDAYVIIEAEDYKSSNMYSVGQIQFSIQKLCSMGAYQDGKLIGWRLLQYDGSFDMVYTLPEFRRLGLASLLSLQLTENIFKMQERVFGYTILNNQKSMGLAAKMGFHHTGIYDWIVFEPTRISKTQQISLLKSSI